MAATQNLEITAGDDQTYNFAVTNNGVPVDITGWTFYFTAKVSVEDPDTAIVMQSSNAIHTNPTQGLSFITLSHTITTVTPSTYVYDLKWVDASGNRDTFVKGNITVDPSVKASL